jgi:hypothetical protein
MPSDEQFTALGTDKPGEATAVGFQTFSTSIDVGVAAEGRHGGVIGRAQNDGIGVHGISSNSDAGVFGQNLGGGDGILGESDSADANGVHGISLHTNFFDQSLGDGVLGEIQSAHQELHNAAIHGKVHRSDATGQESFEYFGDAVLGEVESGPSVAIHGISRIPTLIEQPSGTAVFGENQGSGLGVSGTSSSGLGVFGTSKSGTALKGVSTAGIGGEFGGKRSPLRLIPGPVGSSGPPQFEVADPILHEMGEFYLSSKGELFFCVADGNIATNNPGTWKLITGP